MGWTFEPGQLVPIAVVGALYGRRAWTLRRQAWMETKLSPGDDVEIVRVRQGG